MIKHFCLCLFVAALLIEIYSCQQCSYDTNIDYFGNDLIAEPVFTNSSDGCCVYCAQNSKCQVWTWVPATKACWIKTNVGSKRFKSFGRASGVRQYVSGMNYGSGSYGNNGYQSSGGSYGGYGNQGGYNNGGGYGSNMGYGNNGGYGSNMGYGSYGSGSYGSGYGSGYAAGSYSTSTAAATITTAAVAAATTVTATTTTTATIVVITSTVATAFLPAAAVVDPNAPTTTTVATAVRSTICFIENNANYPGNDLSGQGNINDPGACCTLCGQTTGCVAWSYYKQFNYCFLKSAAPTSPGQTYAGLVSGKIVNPPTTSG